MRGLIWKDILVMRKVLKSYALFLFFYFLLALLGVFDISIVTSVLNIIVLMLPISVFSYDEQAKWARYAAALPLGNRRVVGARYVFTLLLALMAFAFGLLVCLLFMLMGKGNVLESLAAVLVSMGMALFFADVLLPLCYKLGPERARLWMFLIVFLPVIALFLAYRLGLHHSLAFLDQMSDAAVMGLFALVPLLSLAGLGVSFLASCRIAARKEF